MLLSLVFFFKFVNLLKYFHNSPHSHPPLWKSARSILPYGCCSVITHHKRDQVGQRKRRRKRFAIRSCKSFLQWISVSCVHECVTLTDVGLYTFVNMSVLLPSARVCVREFYGGHLHVLVQYVCVCVCVRDAQCKLFRIGSVGFGLGPVIPLFPYLNCGSDCLTPTSSCVFPSLHFLSPHFSVQTIFDLFSSFLFLCFPLLSCPSLSSPCFSVIFFLLSPIVVCNWVAQNSSTFSVAKLCAWLNCCRWGTWINELGCNVCC